MANETTLAIIGNLTADPDLRFTPSGAAVANFTVAATPRTYDKDSREWKDGDALFMRCSVWKEQAENVAESLTKGCRVMVSGRLKQRSYDDRDGNRRTVVELDVEEIGASLRYAVAKPVRAARGGQPAQQRPAQQDDPWGSAPAGGAFGGSDNTDPPF